jgi:hypothetical protein
MDSPALVMLGGALIGCAYGGLRLLTGRVMSASAMIGSLLGGREGLAAASIAFIAGLFIAPSILPLLALRTQPPLEPGWLPLIAGGVLLGFGARLADGGLVKALGGLLRGSGWAIGSLLAILGGLVAALYLVRMLSLGGPA